MHYQFIIKMLEGVVLALEKIFECLIPAHIYNDKDCLEAGFLLDA